MIHFVVHEEGDAVGTVVVEGVTSGAPLSGWIMEQWGKRRTKQTISS